MARGDFSIGQDFWPGTAKLMEEAAEVIQVCGKLIANRGEADHWDGSDLRERLHEEISDMMAAAAFFVWANDLDYDKIDERMTLKLKRFCDWQEADGSENVEDCDV